jgi:hypothetical protein
LAASGETRHDADAHIVTRHEGASVKRERGDLDPERATRFLRTFTGHAAKKPPPIPHAVSCGHTEAWGTNLTVSLLRERSPHPPDGAQVDFPIFGIPRGIHGHAPGTAVAALKARRASEWSPHG